MPSLFMALWAIASERLTGSTTNKAMLAGAVVLAVVLYLAVA